MKRVLGVFLGLIALIIVGIVGVFAFSGTGSGPASDLANDAKAAAANAAIDATGLKDKAKSALEGSKASIAAATGLSENQVDQAIEQLDIDGWQAASLPSTATATGTIDGSALGVSGTVTTVTTYDDPGYVSVEAYGQTVTLAVPESAQAYLPYLAYVQ